MIYPVKKIFNGFASVRDYDVRKCIDLGENLCITFGKERMIVPLERLRRPFQLHKGKNRSRFDGKEYELYDFKWKPDGDNKQSTLL